MKHLAFLVSLVSLSPAFAQGEPNCPTFDTAAVVQMDSVKATELYARAKHWFANRFKDAQEVIQLDDPANGTLIGKGTFGGGLHFTMEIACKDGRYRMNLHSIFHDDPGLSTGYGGGLVQNPDWGTLYDCKWCHALAQSYKVKHPNQHGYEKACTKTLVPQARANVNDIVTSLRKGMATPSAGGSDW